MGEQVMRFGRGILIVSVMLVGCAYGAVPLQDQNAANVLAKLHSADWLALDSASVRRVVADELIKEWASDDHCPVELYVLTLQEKPRETLRMRFEPVSSNAEGSGCRHDLFTVSYLGSFDSQADAESRRIAIVAALRAGGEPIIHGDEWEFRWRSIDSLTRFTLAIRIEKNDTYAVRAVLRHEAVRPETVDYLPFEKGYMGCK